MDIGIALLTAAGMAGFAAVLAGYDFAAQRYAVDPSPDRVPLVRILGSLASVAAAGYYVTWIVAAILLLEPIFGLLGPKRSAAAARPLAVVAVLAAIFLASVTRGLLKRAAQSLASDTTAVPPDPSGLPINAGETLPWFAAMEYYALILNRTYRVFIADGMLCGASVRGLVASPPSASPDMDDQTYWTDTLAATLYDRVDVTSADFLKLGLMNFQILAEDIARIDYDPSSKWGMGNVPHSGKLKVRLKSRRTRELILLGEQDGDALKQQIEAAMARKE
jgi:hypothetical protein